MLSVPCGCKSRDRIMFQDGNLTRTRFITGSAVAALALILVYRRTH